MHLYKVLLAFSVRNEVNKENIIREQTWYEISANTEKEALQNANAIGKKEEEFFVNRHGETIHWKFERIKKIQQVSGNQNRNLIQQN